MYGILGFKELRASQEQQLCAELSFICAFQFTGSGSRFSEFGFFHVCWFTIFYNQNFF